jgi:hypothetical protein
MKGDFTRQAFRPRNHYRGVLQQQGRVQLDADWNEQVLLQAYLDRLVAEDTIGPHGAPEHAAGMAIVGKDGKPPSGPLTPDELQISPGHYYVHGILCENEVLAPLGDQPDLPGVGLPADPGDYIAFLDAWHRLITSAEKPSLREVALGGPDTATRTRTVWQVRVRSATDPLPPGIGSGQLRARADASGEVTSPCDAPTGTGYRRLDNQLYRVEIRDPGDPGTATFLWSRENGSVTARLLKLNGNDLVLDSIGRDGRLSFDKGWVEVTNSERVLSGEPGFLGSIGHVQGNTVTVAAWYGGVAPPDDFDTSAIVRRWESGPSPVALPATPDDWIGLESGVQIQFRHAGFRTGDYWLIPARTANLEDVSSAPGLAGNVDWPQDENGPAYQPAEGIWHVYADIAGLGLSPDGTWTVTNYGPVFPPITELAAAVEVGYSGGDGQRVLPGSALPRPLEVSVTRRGAGVPQAVVRFEAADPDGRLGLHAADLAGSTVAVLDVTVDADGVARCWWRPADDTGRPVQRVTARWIDWDGNLTDPLIDFSAAFALASDVSFDPAGCARLAGADTAQDAIHALAATAALVPAGGDGQDGLARTDLPQPVTVQVRTGCGDPVPGAVVQFSVTSGAVAPTAAGLAGGATSADITAAPDGTAQCWWHLGGETPVQTLTAALLAGTVPHPYTLPLVFVAGVVPDDGIHVTGVVATGSGATLPNDGELAAADLASGLTVRLDRPPDPAAVTGKPVLTVSLDMPYPLSGADRALWGNLVAGTMPLTLAGQAGLAAGASPAVTWTATGTSQSLLESLFGVLSAAGAGDRVLCHLALDGRVTRGAGYVQWFWLVAAVKRVVLVPHRKGRLQLQSGREMVSHAVSRDAIRATVQAGVQLSDQPAQDLAAARRAAGHAFRGQGDQRRLTLIVAEPYAAAAGKIAEALADAARVTVEVVPAADPAAEASSRIAAGQPVDGIITDDTDTPAVTALHDFPEAYPL